MCFVVLQQVNARNTCVLLSVKLTCDNIGQVEKTNVSHVNSAIKKLRINPGHVHCHIAGQFSCNRWLTL